MLENDTPSQMRYFDVTLSPESGGIHPVDRALDAVVGVTRDSLLHVAAFGDGTGVLLYRLSGDDRRARSFAEASDEVLDFDLVDVGDETFHSYLHVAPGEPAGTLMSLCYDHALILETPIRFTDHGEVVITVVGRDDMLREALRATPATVEVTVDQVGEYHPEERDVLSLLTDRQHEVFQTAVELGYYEIPRDVNQLELAEVLDCAPSTVDEHLRKAESKMLSSIVEAPSVR